MLQCWNLGRRASVGRGSRTCPGVGARESSLSPQYASARARRTTPHTPTPRPRYAPPLPAPRNNGTTAGRLRRTLGVAINGLCSGRPLTGWGSSPSREDPKSDCHGEVTWSLTHPPHCTCKLHIPLLTSPPRLPIHAKVRARARYGHEPCSSSMAFVCLSRSRRLPLPHVVNFC